MPKRNLRNVKTMPLPAIGICERCNTQFKSSILYPEADIQRQFDDHKCKPVDSSQNALRIVREATENK